jgi:hypothetical protein
VATKKTDLTGMTEAEKLAALQTKLLDSFLSALSGTKTPPSALLIAASRYLSSEPVQLALKRAATQAAKQATSVSPLELPTFEPYDPEEWEEGGSQAAPEAPQGAIPGGRYGDPEDHL